MDLGSAEVEQRQFRVRRKGFDQGEVTLYLHQVAATMEQLEEAARVAEQRIRDLERDVSDLHALSENGFHQAVATSSLAEPDPIATGDAASSEEAIRLFDAAADHARRLREEAEATLEDALATTAQIVEDQERLLAEAKARSEALIADARAQADVIVADAKESAKSTRSEAQRFAEELRELTAAETIELVTYAKAMAAAILETASGEEVQVSVEDEEVEVSAEDEDVTIDLTEDTQEPAEVEWASGRPSRYEARSANLPRIGEASASEAIDSVETLRET